MFAVDLIISTFSSTYQILNFLGLCLTDTFYFYMLLELYHGVRYTGEYGVMICIFVSVKMENMCFQIPFIRSGVTFII